MKTNVTPGETPEKITVSMIDQDLKDGISKPEMAIKYGIKPWEVDEMFKHPFLKGRRPSKKKHLSFSFIDDVTTNKTRYVSVDAEETAEEVDPNQVTLEDAIDEAIETVEEVKTELKETEEAIVEMLSPTDPEETVEILLNEINDNYTVTEITGIPNGDVMSDTDDEEEIEINEEDNSFNL